MGAIGMMLSGGQATAPGGDPYWLNAVLLCHFEGPNGANTPAPVDMTGRHALAFAGGGALYSTAQKKFGTSSLDMSAATSGNVRSADSADWAFGAGSFTVEAWGYFTAAPSTSVRGLVTQFGGASNLGWLLGMVTGEIAFYYSTTGSDSPHVGASWTPTLNTWYHIAADRDASNMLRVYVDGVVKASATVASALFDSSQSLVIGNDNNATRPWPGYVDEARITKGVARYAGAFTPPTAPFPDH